LGKLTGISVFIFLQFLVLIVAGYISTSLYASIFAINSPDAQWVKILTYLPPFSFFLESSRTLLGISNVREELFSWAVAIFATLLVAVLGIRSFEKRVFLS
jgi:ABC-type Na+ efflux pump permease subunit